jgi:hypothetical protein
MISGFGVARRSAREEQSSALHRPAVLAATAMTGPGHEDQFRPTSLNGRYRLGEATFAGMGSKEEDAPLPDIRGAVIEPLGFDPERTVGLLLLLPIRICSKGSLVGHTGSLETESYRILA